MKRTMTLAVAGVLAFAGGSRAQYAAPTREAPMPSPQAQRLINSRYQQQRSNSAPSWIEAPPSTMRDTQFYPLASIRQIFVAELGREPSDQEAGYWLRRMNYLSLQEIAATLRARQPMGWAGHYDPRHASAYDPGYDSSPYPDPASLNFRDAGGPYFKSPYFPNYEYRRPIRAFPLAAQG